MADQTGPLDERDLEAINGQLDQLKFLTAEIERAARAGLDVTDLRAQRDENERKLRQIKQAYFPNR